MGSWGSGGWGSGPFGGYPPSNTSGLAQSNPTNATFTYRQLVGPYNEPMWSAYYSGAQAVAQAIMTRLMLFEGEWWESVTDGTPWWQQILGQGTPSAQIALLIQNRILGTPYVTGITNLEFNFSNSTRGFGLSANVQTALGPTTVTYSYPTPQPQGISL